MCAQKQHCTRENRCDQIVNRTCGSKFRMESDDEFRIELDEGFRMESDEEFVEKGCICYKKKVFCK